MGAIFMLHHIRPGGGLQRGFAPNAGLELTPEFLDTVISHAKSRGYELLSLEAAVRRLEQGETAAEPFAVFTIDDGYRDNLVHAWPVFRRHQCPFTIFVAPAITDGTCELWWRGLEAVIAGEARVRVRIGDEDIELDAFTDAQKQAAFERLYWPVRSMEQHAQREWIRDFCEARGVNLEAICRAEAMTWTELRQISADPLCSIGAHTVNHFAVAKLDPEEVRAEVVASRDRIQQELGILPKFFAYPYGDETSAGPRDFEIVREAGFEAAVTTRKGLIFPAHKDHLLSLPRVSLNGGFQKLRYVDVLMSGTAFMLWNGLKRVKAA
ncbi:MAG: polysaccharide deacetylase family protein [Rhizobiales bacterium]|nr:polysaccharide deacetylase family protein [Hyphomicrobiales bacterium]